MNTSKQVIFFDKITDLYNEIRPGYDERVFREIAEFLKPNQSYKLLEIGAGNGIATDKIIEFWQSELILIEPSKNLSRLLKTKYSGHSNIKIINDTFENAALETNYFDAIFAATAFHWLNSETKFIKTHKLLKKDGLLILFWNNYLVNDHEQRTKIQEVYQKYTGIQLEKTIDEIQMEKIENRKNEIINSQLFQLSAHKMVETVKLFAAEEYIKLLKTFPDHNDFPDAFFNEISNIIASYENSIQVKITLNLEIAKKS